MKVRLGDLMRFWGVVTAVVLGGVNVASSQAVTSAPAEATLYSYCTQFQGLYVEIRQQTVTPSEARLRFSQIMNGLKARFAGNGASAGAIMGADTLTPADSVSLDSLQRSGNYFVFPLRGYGPSAIGGTHGEGYRGKGFDLFDYNVRGSHPAQDIFIRDTNQDCLDDRSRQPVDILAMTSGLVLAIETGWQPGSEYRGGNWIWVYDPVMHGLFYYAHNNVVDVTPGQWVQAGQKLATMGRSGYNAYKTRSPTHLHLMYLHLLPDGLPVPRNTYSWLLTARRQ
ncbi:peptidoglycan DD-metalloendopeptidase family protein [Rudanella paleaurantiibacter]|uniref:Peptidoglycan DD-metalloendopeptidase family protein n=2 Tax=Rudanella paleaurantiibacter TaxID=2614655 RepID=A0A7J5U3K3_9BACT|nr:peptidoglycan DD-metalloendopeptidase family protein [Rudanella paleaurantiibacter]